MKILISAVVSTLLPSLAEGAAPTSLNYSLVNTCNTQLGLSCAGGSLLPHLTTLRGSLITAFFGILFGMMVFYGIRMVVMARDESAVSESKMAFFYALMGTAMVGGSALLADTFAIENTLITPASGNALINNIIAFFRGLLLAAVLLNLVIQGYRIITATDDSGMQKGRQKIIHAAIGAGIVLLVDRMIFAVTGGGAGVISVELAGIGRFIATIFGALAVIGILVAGVMLIVSVDEALKDRAKKLVIACAIALVIVIAAFGIINSFALSI